MHIRFWFDNTSERALFKATKGMRQTTMIREYLDHAIRWANYEMLADDNSFYAEIPGFQGVLANAATLEECRSLLESTLEEWILFRVSRSLMLPTIDGLEA